MRRRPVIGSLLKSAPVAAALIVSPVAQATSVKMVFSAENALYGAGYQIGQADGWIDDNLRSAIKQYQADRPELAASGELDTNTLKALGISARASQVVGGNTVNSRSAALAELGLSEDRYQQTPALIASTPAPEPVVKKTEKAKVAPAPTVANVPEPEVEKEPEPDSKPVEIIASVQEPEPQKPEAVTEEPASSADPVKEDKPKPQQVAKAEPEPFLEDEPQASSEPEPDSEPVQIKTTFGFSESNDVGSASVESDSSEPGTDASLASNAGDVESVLPQEPTAAGVAPDADAAPAEAESSGNVLTKVFDFLFGWMV